MVPMFSGKVVPFLQKDQTSTLVSKRINIFGMGESQVESELSDMMTSYSNPTIAPYAKPIGVEVRVTAKAKNKEEAFLLIDPVIEKIRERLGSVIYGVDVANMQEAVVTKLKEKKLTLATAESCTGGGLSEAITSIPGASEVFGCGVCTYSNDMKQKLLGVKEQTLIDHGAVSEQTAIEMAQGVTRNIRRRHRHQHHRYSRPRRRYSREARRSCIHRALQRYRLQREEAAPVSWAHYRA